MEDGTSVLPEKPTTVRLDALCQLVPELIKFVALSTIQRGKSRQRFMNALYHKTNF
jgi:hypothetical protein